MNTERLNLDYSGLGEAFSGKADPASKPKIENISAAAWTGDRLWTASDEGASVECLAPVGDGFGAAASLALGDWFDWIGEDDEADLEALAWDEGRLWLCGSHARSRGRSTGMAEDRILRKVRRARVDKPEKARTLLGYVPLASADPAVGKARALPPGKRKGSLLWAIRKQGGALAASLKMPSKENGFDVEGLAAKGQDLMLGLRGPALGGYAIILRLSVKSRRDRLAIEKRSGRYYSAAYLGLNGLGIRGLLRRGDDVLILAGPSLDTDGPYVIYRWRDAFGTVANDDIVVGDKLEFVLDLPSGRRASKSQRMERPECMTLLSDGRLLIMYDRPNSSRFASPGVLAVDVIALS